jgi:hypothetical protein
MIYKPGMLQLILCWWMIAIYEGILMSIISLVLILHQQKKLQFIDLSRKLSRKCKLLINKFYYKSYVL